MLDRADRMVLAVHDVHAAAETFATLLGAEVVRRDGCSLRAAGRVVMALGESELELLQPDGTGPVQEHLNRKGEGLMAAGFSSPDIMALAARWREMGVPFETAGNQLLIGPPATPGFPMVISASADRPRVGPVSYFYEATNALVSDWREAAATYVRLFDLDASRFSEIGSPRFGYVGTLTLFDPPKRLDRIELSQVTDSKHAMGRYAHKHGDCLYMCYIETHDIIGLLDRLLDNDAKLTPRGRDIMKEYDGFWVHPKDLHGMLLGVSRTKYAWNWSGRPELVPPFKS